MKILDRYVIRNFLVGYVISFGVLMGLRIMTDLFINLDEFTEHPDLSTARILWNIADYYTTHSFLYFRDFAGMITVVAAVFSLGKMTRSNELVAIMASGVSLKRTIAPILFMALFFTGLHIIDQEFIIPPLADKLVRPHDAVTEKLFYDMWFISDSKGSLFNSPQFKVQETKIIAPTIITRSRRQNSGLFDVTGIIRADSAYYDFEDKVWIFENGVYVKVSKELLDRPYESIKYYPSDLTPRDIPVRRKSAHMDLLGSYDLVRLARQNPKDIARLYAQKNFRLTDPIINLVMLMISLPVLVCRDPRSLKNAVFVSFVLTGLCYIITFVSKILASEAVFGGSAMPAFWAWLPIFIFLPVAVIEMDSMKT